MGQSDDLLVVGAYPGGANYDIRRGNPAEHAAALRHRRRAHARRGDPVSGREGARPGLWRAAPGHAGASQKV
jgi:uncharacterized protein YjlB